MKRYLLVTSRYIYHADDQSAQEAADMDAKIERLKYDNGSAVVSLQEAPFGELSLRDVK